MATSIPKSAPAGRAKEGTKNKIFPAIFGLSYARHTFKLPEIV